MTMPDNFMARSQADYLYDEAAAVIMRIVDKNGYVFSASCAREICDALRSDGYVISRSSNTLSTDGK